MGGCHRLIVGLLFAGKTPPPPSPQATLAGNLRKQVRRHNPWASPGVTVNKHQSPSWDVLPATLAPAPTSRVSQVGVQRASSSAVRLPGKMQSRCLDPEVVVGSVGRSRPPTTEVMARRGGRRANQAGRG